MKVTDFIIYEQPMNETTRVCLRLEHLFDQMVFFSEGENSCNSRIAIDSILEILQLLDRADLKANLTKELQRFHAQFSRHLQTRNIDQTKLADVLAEINDVIEALKHTESKLGQPLRENDFLNSIRLYRSNPGGTCDFDVPAYNFWLKQPHEARIKAIQDWYEELGVAEHTAKLLLRLIRGHNMPEVVNAANGLYQLPLDPKLPCLLIRIAVPKNQPAYPIISGGKHRLVVHFFSLNLQGKPAPISHDVDFQLTCCSL